MCRSKLLDESRLIQRSFDNNKGDDKKQAQRSRILDDNKDDDLKNQRMSSRCSRLNQEHFKVQEKIGFQESRFKVQASKNQDQDSRLKIQE